MTMKQTQTKLFDFSDVGLDFCAGSKTLFPTVFKKMLAQGYNPQTVSSVSVSGNQVVFTYGVNHGYVADRVLKVDSGPLSAINDGEFWIDSVTANTVTFTLDDAPSSIAGGFGTKIASLGWSLEYESANIHVYKLKHIDESDLFLRLCFQDQTARRNCISPCIGKNFNPTTGFITDANALAVNKEIMSPANDFKWEFGNGANSSFNSSNYAAGVSNFGRGVVIGSQYHIAFLTNCFSSAGYGVINGLFPTSTLSGYSNLNYPVLLGSTNGNIASNNSGLMITTADAYVGSTRVIFITTTSTTPYIDVMQQAINSFLPNDIDSFNTTTAEIIPMYIRGNGQFVGFINGMYRLKYSNSNAPAMLPADSPSTTTDIDLNSKVKVHYIAGGGTAANAVFFAVPIEEIKID